MLTSIEILNPPSNYRPAPFWSWNDKLDPEELRRQVREMHEAGIGGFFMHARGGLQTKYLSQEWMDCVCACLDEAGKCGMNAWLYDVNGWPSGFGGGLVNGLGVKYQQKYLRHEVMEAAEAAKAERTIAFYTEDGSEFLGRELPEGVTGKVLRCYYDINRYYVDNLDAEVVAEFLRVTHQHYYESLPSGLLKHLKGIFTDEPQLSRAGLLWSFTIEAAYQKAYGRDLLADLPCLFLELPGHEAMRIRFWNLTARLFREHFMKQIREWCDAHGWMLTGHHVLEETLQWQISSNGAVMPQYQYYNMPGVDHLGRTVPSPILTTQVASVAAQFGQKQILTESFALSGWNCNFTGQRWIYQPELVRGVNFLCQHLEGYSLRGLRKRDYPASAFYHQPWWKDYRKMNDYFSRLGMILSEGEQIVDTLVVHPLSSAWTLYAGVEAKEEIHHYTQGLRDMTDALDAHQVNHHYADEVIVQDCGSLDGDAIRIGLRKYRLVVIPKLFNLSRNLYGILREFTARGGVVFRVLDDLHKGGLLLDGVPAEAGAQAWFDALPCFATAEEAAVAVAAMLPEIPQVQEDGKLAREVMSTVRRFDSLDGRAGLFYFFTTTKYLQDSNLHFSLPATGETVECFDACTGNFRSLKGVRTINGRLELDYPLAGADAVAFFVPQKAGIFEVLDRVSMFSKNPICQLDAPFQVKASTPNVLTLDHCQYSVDGGAWNEADLISLQARLVNLEHDVDLKMRFAIEIGEDFDLATPLTLLVETPWLFQFSLNGEAFQGVDGGYEFDKAFRKIALPVGKLHAGSNTLELAMRFSQSPALYQKLIGARKFESERNNLTFDSEVESVYILGNFGLSYTGTVEELPRQACRYNDGKFVITAQASGTIDASNLLKAGLPFFAGKLTLESKVTLTAAQATARYLRFAPLGANSWKATVNGKPAGECYWGPYVFPVDGLLHEGENTIEIELATSLRNMLGPHHLAEGDSYGVGPTSFNREDGLFGNKPPKNVDGFCFVHLGISGLELL